MEPNIIARMYRKLNEAEGYLQLEMPLRALEILASFSDWATMKFEASLLEGEALRMMGRYRDALVPLEAAAALRKGHVEVAIALGWCYKRTHRLAQAIDALKVAVAEHPEEGLLHYNLACYWSLLGDADKSLDYLATALRLDTDFLELVRGESDFDPIRAHPEFGRLVGRAASSC